MGAGYDKTKAAKAKLAGYSPELRDALDAHRERLARVTGGARLDRLRKLYRGAVDGLEAKLRDAAGGGRGDTFGALQHRILLAQARQGVAQIEKQLAGHSAELSHAAQVEALRGLEEDVARLEKQFTGAHVVLPTAEAGVFSGIVEGRRQSLLSQHASSMANWGAGAVDQIQEQLALSLATGDTTDAAIGKVADATRAEFWRAERVVRTETAWAYNSAISDGIVASAAELGDIYGRWVEFCDDLGAPLDDRVGVDSIAMHGQLARPGEQFFMPAAAPHPDAEGKTDVPIALVGKGWAHPPNRPNDRAVLQPWRPGWGIPGWVYVGGQRRPYSPDLLPPTPTRPYELAAPKAKADLESGAGFASELPEEAPPLTADVALAEKYGEARGSNEGGFYRGSDGVERYVKFYDDPLQAHVEHLAGSVYRDLGIGAPKTATFEPPGPAGRLAFASEILPGFRTVEEAGLSAERAKELADGFVADVLLGNWDVMGATLDNVGVSGGRAQRIDNGSALFFRARGGKKTGRQLFAVSEFDSFFDPSVAPTYSRVLAKAGLSQPEDMRSALRAQMARVRELRQSAGGWAAYVDRVLPGADAAAREEIAAVLRTREAILGDYCDQSVLRHDSKLGRKVDAERGNSGAHAAATRAGEADGMYYFRRVQSWIYSWTSGGRANEAHREAFEALEARHGALPNPHAKDLQESLDAVAGAKQRAARWRAFMDAAKIKGEVPTHIEAFRAVGSDDKGGWAEAIARSWADLSTSEVVLPVDAAASFSRDRKYVESNFLGRGDGAVIQHRAPLEEILADQIGDDGRFITDFLDERELITGLLEGGLQGRMSLPKHEQTVWYKYEEYTYADRHKLFAVLEREGKKFRPADVAAQAAAEEKKVAAKVGAAAAQHQKTLEILHGTGAFPDPKKLAQALQSTSGGALQLSDAEALVDKFLASKAQAAAAQAAVSGWEYTDEYGAIFDLHDLLTSTASKIPSIKGDATQLAHAVVAQGVPIPFGAAKAVAEKFVAEEKAKAAADPFFAEEKAKLAAKAKAEEPWLYKTASGKKVTKAQIHASIKEWLEEAPTAASADIKYALNAEYPELAKAPGYAEKLYAEYKADPKVAAKAKEIAADWKYTNSVGDHDVHAVLSQLVADMPKLKEDAGALVAYLKSDVAGYPKMTSPIAKAFVHKFLYD